MRNEDAQWLIRMVEILSITRMSGGQAKIEKDCQAAEEIVGVSVSKFTKRFPAIHVSIEVPDEVLMVPMDATLIRQVIMNLLENAAIHGGNVTQIRVCLSREGTNACFPSATTALASRRRGSRRFLTAGFPACRTTTLI